MNKVSFILFFSLWLFSSCNKNNISEIEKLDQLQIINNLTTTLEYSIPIKAGYFTEVIYNNEVIANAVSSFKIQIPKNITSNTKSESIVLNYIPINEYPNELENNSKLYQVICFEDSQKSDYDYNDLVIHTVYIQQGNKFGFAIHPIALGSTKPIKLGCIIYKGKTQVFKGIINSDENTCRSQWFESNEGILNTYSPNFYPKKSPDRVGWHSYLLSTMNWVDLSNINDSGSARIEWYIVVDGNKELYALSTKYLSSSLNIDQLPYGLIISSTGTSYIQDGKVCGYDWFNYPIEGNHLKNVYPEIWDWINNRGSYDFNNFYDATLKEGAFPAADLGLYILDGDGSNQIFNKGIKRN